MITLMEGYGVRNRIRGCDLVHPTEFHTFHEAVYFASHAYWSAVHKIVAGLWLEPADAICVNGEWFIEETHPMAHLFINGEYDEESGASEVTDDILGESETKPRKAVAKKAAKAKAKAKAPPAKAKVAAKPKAKVAAKAAVPAKGNGRANNGLERGALADTAVIKIKKPRDRARPDTESGKAWLAIKSGMTVRDYKKAISKAGIEPDKANGYLRWLIRAEHIAVK